MWVTHGFAICGGLQMTQHNTITDPLGLGTNYLVKVGTRNDN